MRSNAANGMGIMISTNANSANQIRHLVKKVILDYFSVDMILWFLKTFLNSSYRNSNHHPGEDYTN